MMYLSLSSVGCLTQFFLMVRGQSEVRLPVCTVLSLRVGILLSKTGGGGGRTTTLNEVEVRVDNIHTGRTVFKIAANYTIIGIYSIIENLSPTLGTMALFTIVKYEFHESRPNSQAAMALSTSFA